MKIINSVLIILITVSINAQLKVDTSFFYSGEIESIESYDERGKLQGNWTRLFENGNVYIQGKFVDGNREGEWKIYHKTDEGGNVCSEIIFYKKDHAEGLYQRFHSNGDITIKGNYKEGLKNGQWAYYSDNIDYSPGKLPYATGFYSNGVKSGVWKTYHYESTDIASKGEYINGLKSGVWEFIGGDKYQVEVERKVYLKGELNGKYTKHRGEDLIEEGTFKEGKKSGLYVISDHQKEEFFYENGLLHGDHTILYDNKITLKTQYIKGREHGIREEWIGQSRKVKTWFDHGRIAKMEIYSESNELTFLEEHWLTIKGSGYQDSAYSESHSPYGGAEIRTSIITYEIVDVLPDTQDETDRTVIINNKVYHASIEINTRKKYDINGELYESVFDNEEGYEEYDNTTHNRALGDYDQTTPDMYYTEGSLLWRGTVNDGNMEGKWVLFYKNGNTAQIAHYLNGKPIGDWKYFNADGELRRQILIDKEGASFETEYDRKLKMSRSGHFNLMSWDEETGGEVQLLPFQINDWNKEKYGSWMYFDSSDELVSVIENGRFYDEYDDYFTSTIDWIYNPNEKIWVCDFPGSNKSIEGAFNPEKTGVWKYTGEDGSLDSTGSYTNGIKTGVWQYYDNDQLIKENSFNESGLLNGRQTEYKEGEIDYAVNYVNGMLADGVYTKMLNEDTLSHYVILHGKKTGFIQQFHFDYYFNEETGEDELIGNGTLRYKEQFVDGFMTKYLLWDFDYEYTLNWEEEIQLYRWQETLDDNETKVNYYYRDTNDWKQDSLVDRYMPYYDRREFYKNGALVGSAYYWHYEEGTSRSESDKDGKLLWSSKRDTNNVLTDSVVYDTEVFGIDLLTRYHPNGKIKYRTTHISDTIIETEYFSSGAPKLIKKHVNKAQGEVNGRGDLNEVSSEEWDSAGLLIASKNDGTNCTYQYYPSRELKTIATNGSKEVYNLQGAVDSVLTLDEFINDGYNYDEYYSEEYDDNGDLIELERIKTYGPVPDTIIRGEKVWYEIIDVSYDGEYNQDEETYEIIAAHTFSYGQYLKGKHGKWITISNSPNEEYDSIIQLYENGSLKGVTQKFKKNKLIEEVWYSQNEITKRNTFYPNGDKASMTRIDGDLTRTVMYLESGNIRSEMPEYWLYSGELSYEGFIGEKTKKGKFVSGGNYKNGVKEGYWKNDKEEGKYVNGIKQGKWKQYSSWYGEEDKEGMEKGVYEKGLKVGEWLFSRYDIFNEKKVYKEGTLIETYTYDDKGNLSFSSKINGKERDEIYYGIERDGYYYASENKKERIKSHHYYNDILLSTTNTNGTIHYDSVGRMHGPVNGYYSGGEIHQKKNFDHGLKNGAFITFEWKGNIQLKENYYRDSLHGAYIGYYQNGQISEEGNYHHGEKVGIWKTYDVFGQEKSNTNYDEQTYSSPLNIITPTSNKSSYQKISSNGKYAFYNNGNLWDLERRKIVRTGIENSLISASNDMGGFPRLMFNELLSNTGVYLTKEHQYSNLITGEIYDVKDQIVAFSSDDKYLITQQLPYDEESDIIQITVINTRTREVISQFVSDRNNYKGVTFSSDDKLLYEVQKQFVFYRDINTGEELKKIRLQKDLNSEFNPMDKYEGLDHFILKNDQLLIFDRGNIYMSGLSGNTSIYGVYVYDLNTGKSHKYEDLNNHNGRSTQYYVGGSDFDENGNLALLIPSSDEYDRGDSLIIYNVLSGEIQKEPLLSNADAYLPFDANFNGNNLVVQNGGGIEILDVRTNVLEELKPSAEIHNVYTAIKNMTILNVFCHSIRDTIVNRHNVIDLAQGTLINSSTYDPIMRMDRTKKWNLEDGIEDINRFDSIYQNLIIQMEEKDTLLVRKFIKEYPDEVQSYRYSSAVDNKIIFFNEDRFQFVNLDKVKPIERHVDLLTTATNDYLFIAPDHYYLSTKGIKDQLYFEKDLKIYPFEQFDLKYNRPDIILDRLGYADSSLLQSYHKAYQKRLKKMGFTEDMLKADFHLPEIKIENFEYMPTITDSSSIRLNLNIEDTKYNLDRINIWINDVAVYGANGITLRDKNIQNYQTSLDLNLVNGHNKIQVSVLNQAGAESYKETFEIECTSGKQKPDLYIITIGDSKFKDANYNLTYAAKDAQDIADLFSESKVYDQVKSKTLTNDEVTKENIIELRSFLEQADINDEVMIFVAGHGVLDQDLDYFFATYDMDFNNPSDRGLAYEDLEGLLDGIAPLKKTLLIDACHSGEIDKEEVELMAQETTEMGDIQFRAVGNSVAPKLGMQNTSELTKSLFTDLRKGTGATVISSAGGMEFAMESGDWQNGLFTYCLINGLKSSDADLNDDGEIWLSELKQYVQEQVTALSKGKQQPTSRIENNTLDYRVW
jgi:antitoxin component YwqK of YwqJK toxin-antitoxin module